eukprot:g5909.t1
MPTAKLSQPLLESKDGNATAQLKQVVKSRGILAFIHIHLTPLLLFLSLLFAALQTAAVKELTNAGAQNCTYIERDSDGHYRHASPRYHNTRLLINSRKGRHYHRPENVFENAISVFNILVYGNAVVCIAMFAIYGRREAVNAAKRLTKYQWMGLSAGALLYSAFCQCFTFLALQETTAINVSVLTRLEPIIIMALARFALQEKIVYHNAVSAAIVLFGISFIYVYPVLFEGSDFTFGFGEICAVLAAICVSCSSIISKTLLSDIPLGLFIIYRCFLGTILFSVIGMILNGEANLVNPLQLCSGVMKYVFLYAILTLAALLFWFSGVKRASAQLLSLSVSLGFVISLLVSYFVLGEVPSTGEMIGALIILAALIIAQMGDLRERRRKFVLDEVEMENHVNESKEENLENGLDENVSESIDKEKEGVTFLAELVRVHSRLVESLEKNVEDSDTFVGATLLRH